MNALVVGSGWAAHAARAFASRADTAVRGVVARGSTRSFDLAKSLDVPLFGSLDEAISETQPTIAVVAIGDTENPAAVGALLRAGAHVLCAHPVAPTASDVAALAALAREHDRIVSADYSMRATDSFRAARAATLELGDLLRVEVTFPGRFLPIAIDLAIAFAGRVEKVAAFGRYPENLRDRRATSPAAFPPTVVLEHAAGAVTALSPSPHAVPSAAIRLTASSTGGRVDVELPCGGARRVRCRAAGAFEETILLVAYGIGDPRSTYAEAMQATAHAFVEAALGRGPVPSPLDDEIEVRRVWGSIPRALRDRASIAVDVS